MVSQTVTLFFREGSSDKVYWTAIEKLDGAYVVNFAFGRRGSTLNAGTKTPAPVPFDQAKKIFDKLVATKKAKGYSEGLDGTPYAGISKAERDTGLRPQLLNPITEDDVERYLRDDSYWMQEKLDGRRMLLRMVDGEVTGINRKGLTVALPEPVVAFAKRYKGDLTLDGEAIGDKLVAFDCLVVGAVTLNALPYSERWKALADLVQGGGAIQVLPAVSKPGDKRDMLRFLREKKAEGVVFKDCSAPYTQGRPSSGGPQVKLKFYATASCIVAPGRTGKRSVGLEVLDGGKRIPVGNVTIPGKQPIPKAGTVVEIRYLYMYPGGSLYQPVYLGVRHDILTADCKLAQLKLRRDDAEDES